MTDIGVDGAIDECRADSIRDLRSRREAFALERAEGSDGGSTTDAIFGGLTSRVVLGSSEDLS